MEPQRISTGITGLHSLLHGGFVKGRTDLLTGDTGAGKTLACLQFMLSGLNQGEKAVSFTVDPRPPEIFAGNVFSRFLDSSRNRA